MQDSSFSGQIAFSPAMMGVIPIRATEGTAGASNVVQGDAHTA